MLGASEAECSASIKELSLVHTLTELALEQRPGDEQRQGLARWLEIERRKFLMAAKVGAFVALDERMTLLTATRPGLRRAAITAVRELIDVSVTTFRARLQPAAVRRLAMIPSQLVEEVQRALGHVSEPLPLATIANVPVTIHAFSRDLLDTTTVSFGFTCVRIERAARDELSEGLERRTQLATQLVLRDYDDIRASIEEQMLDMLESWIETAKSAAEFARRAREGKNEYTARAQVARWIMALAKISAGITSP
jgi:hypothetical protein